MQITVKLSSSMIEELNTLSGDIPLKSYIRQILKDHIGGLSAVNDTELGIQENEDKDETIRPDTSAQSRD